MTETAKIEMAILFNKMINCHLKIGFLQINITKIIHKINLL